MSRITRTLVATAALAALVAAPGGAQAASGPSLRATPRVVTFGDAEPLPNRITVSGRRWGQTEFCSPRIVVRLDGRRIRNVRTTNGRFTFAYTVPEAIGDGVHVLRAVQRCESGEDGSAIWLRKAFRITVQH